MLSNNAFFLTLAISSIRIDHRQYRFRFSKNKFLRNVVKLFVMECFAS